MKKILAISALVLVLTASGYAQEKRDTIRYKTPATRAEKVKLKDELGLSRKQNKEMKAEQKEFKAKRAELEKDTALTATDRKQKLRELQSVHLQKIDSTLTPEQRVKVREMRRKKKNAG